ncbi:hypothetical protein E5D57_000006 [Metarhizium anisopliae]|nr:hypothetical protein E5D57_000006 [Metarhizium anisopliae]
MSFEDPRLVIQSHDLKNTFGQDTLEETLKRFQDTVLRAFHPDQLDGASCWMDIGSRDCVPTPSLQDYSKEPCSILWKSPCHHRLHKRLSETSPEVSLNQFYFRSFLLRDVGTYLSKVKVTRDANPGHPKSCKAGLIHAKAYNCNKDLFSVMFSDYRTFGSGFLPLLALSDTLIKDLDFTSQKGQRLSTARVTRASLLRAWEANKRHVKAMSESQILANYGARREITLRLDAILLMQDRGCFNPHLHPHTGRLTVRLHRASVE